MKLAQLAILEAQNRIRSANVVSLADYAKTSVVDAKVAPLALKSEVPQPANAMPPAVNEIGATGTETQMFALKDHTHKSNAQWKELIVNAGGKAVWTFDTPFASPPYIIASAITPIGVTYANIAIPEPASIFSVAIRVEQLTKNVTLPTLLTSLLGAVVGLFASAPSGVKVHVLARPT